MTELLDADIDVRTGAGGAVAAVHLDGRWQELDRVVARWRVETDWWRSPVRRDYWRCVLVSPGVDSAVGECVEICRDHLAGRWSLVRRYD